MLPGVAIEGKQSPLGVVIFAGIAGAELVVVNRVEVHVLFPHAFAVLITIVIGEFPTINLTDLVPCPEIIDHPSETIHVYVIAPWTSSTLKSASSPIQAGFGPVI